MMNFIIHVNKIYKDKGTKTIKIIISKYPEILDVIWTVDFSPTFHRGEKCPRYARLQIIMIKYFLSLFTFI